MQSHIAILIAYRIGMKEDYQTLLNFAVIAGKWQQNAPFDIKSPVKISCLGQRGGIAPLPAP